MARRASFLRAQAGLLWSAPRARAQRNTAKGQKTPILVGLDRLELSTSRLSGVRSNHLSYRPPAWSCSLPAVLPSPPPRSRIFIRSRRRRLRRLAGNKPSRRSPQPSRTSSQTVQDLTSTYSLISQRTESLIESEQRVGSVNP